MRKTTILTALIMLMAVFTAQSQMVLQYNTNLSAGTTITLPLAGTVNVTVDWGDGNNEAITTAGNLDHTYASENTYTVQITGSLSHFGASGYSNSDKLTTVSSWGDLGLTSLNYAFHNATNLTAVPTSIPTTITNMSYMFYNASSFNQDLNSWDVSNVTDMGNMFYQASNFNGNISNWNVSSVTTMDRMFRNVYHFNQDISNWDVSNVVIMSFMFQEAHDFNQDISNWDVHNNEYPIGMFDNAYSFNQDISSWDVSNAITMSHMFDGATSFNQDLNSWDVSNVTDMSNMFSNTSNFNGNISSWDVSNVTNMLFMFKSASNFNQDISNWDVSNVTNMGYMFRDATSFDQDLSSWNVSQVTNMTDMFKNISLSTTNYDAILNAWSQLTLQNGVTFNGGNSQYSCQAAAARQSIIDTYTWTITDGGDTLLAPANGDGSVGNPYQIATLCDLKWLSETDTVWDKYFIQTADIDATITNTWNVGDHDGDAGTPDEPMGFSPIGIDYTFSFEGSYNGQGHTIDGLFINRPNTDMVGMFGFLNNASIDSVGIINIDVTGNTDVGGIAGFVNNNNTINKSYCLGEINGYSKVGGLVGENYDNSTINYSYFSGDINSTGVYTGGLVGYNDNYSTINYSYNLGNVSSTNGNIGGLVGQNINYSTISNSYNQGDVTSDASGVGGLVGKNSSNAIINNSYNNSSVMGVNDVGGFAGANFSSINNVYSFGSVIGENGVGGLVGGNYTNNSEINKSYSVSIVAGTSNVGGLVGTNVSVITNSFYNIDSTAISAGGTGLTTAEMQKMCVYADSTWDFMIETVNGTDDIWGLNASENGGYPFLAWQGYSHTESCCGYVDLENPTFTPQNTTIYLDATGNATLITDSVLTNASDNCVISDTTLSQTSFDCSDVSTPVNIDVTLTDTTGNFITEQATITVADTLSPTEPTLANVTGECSATATAPTTTDNCAGTVTGTTSDSLTYTEQGTYTITWTFDDGNGNTTTQTQNVVLEDTTNPTISCIENQTITLNQGDTLYTVQGIEFDPTATDDNCNVVSTVNDVNSSATLDGETLPIGTTTITWTVTDNTGNTDSCSFDVTVNAYESINDISASGISVYPNPTSGKLTVKNEKLKINKLEISDITGKIIYNSQFTTQNSQFEIDLSSYGSGIYIISIQTDKAVFTTKVVKE